MSNIDISVAIPVKNGQKYLDEVLRAIFSQKINLTFEVIIVDSGSTDNTLEIIKRYPVRLYQIREEEFNHGLTRNYAISKAQGKYVILLTADAIPFDNCWMDKLVSNLLYDQEVAGAYSMQIAHQDSHPLTQVRVNRYFTASKFKRISQINKFKDYDKLFPREKHKLCNFDNVSSCIRKEIWEKIPFSKTDFGEDLEWSQAVLLRGHKIIYEPDSKVYHSHDFTFRGWYKKNRINYNKLFTLFGLRTINNVFKLIFIFFVYAYRDSYLFCKSKKPFKTILNNIYLIPIYSFFGALGQYKGAKVSGYPKAY